MKRPTTGRIWAASALFVLAGVVHTVAFFNRVDVEGVLQEQVQSDVSDHDRRFAKLKPKLSGETTIGYLTPLAPAVLQSDPIQASFFFQAQYSLAPLLVVPNITPPRVVADLQALAHLSAVFEADDGDVLLLLPTVDMASLKLEENLREDILLYRRTRR